MHSCSCIPDCIFRSGSSTKKRKHTTDAAAESKALKKEGAPADVKAAKKAAKKKALAAGATDAEAKAAQKGKH